MKLKDLKNKGAFVDAAPVAKDIEWKHFDEKLGEEVTDKFTVLVKRQSFGSMEKALTVDPKDPERSRNASIIAESILFGDDGSERISYAEAYSLHPSLAFKFIEAITDVNGASGPKR